MEALTERFGVIGGQAMVLLCLYVVAQFSVKYVTRRVARRLNIDFKKDNEHLAADAAWVKAHWLDLLPIGLLISVVIAPICEEILYRVPIMALAPHVVWSPWWLIIPGAIIFSIAHHPRWNQWFRGELAYLDASSNGSGSSSQMIVARLITAFLIGVLLGYVGVQSGSLLVVVGLHASWNLLAAFGIPGTVVMVVWGVVCLVGFLLVWVVTLPVDATRKIWRRRRRLQYETSRLAQRGG